jgi:hypothetical protein
MKIYCLFALVLASLPAMGQPGVSISFDSVQVFPKHEFKTTKPEERVAEFIAKLASDSAEERRTAAQALEEMGPAIEAQIRWAWQHEEQPPRGVWLRQPYHTFHELKVILSHLEEQQHKLPSLVTLHYTNDLLTNILADFGRQVGAEVRLGTLDFNREMEWTKTNRVTIDVNRTSYWAALEQIKQVAGLAEVLSTDKVRPPPCLGLARTSFWAKPIPAGNFVVSGPLKVSLSTDGQALARSKVSLKIQSEPKLSNIGTNALVQVDECVDDGGQSLIETKSPTFDSLPIIEHSVWNVPMQLKAPTGNRIKSLKGSLSVALTLPQCYLTITNLMRAQGQSCEFDNIRIDVRGVSEQGDSNVICIEISAPAGSPFARTFANSYDWEFGWVLDETGQGIRIGYMNRTGPSEAEILGVVNGKDKRGRDYVTPQAWREFKELRHEEERDVIAWNLYFPKDLEPATLDWHTPVSTRWLTVPFEMHDVEIPQL